MQFLAKHKKETGYICIAFVLLLLFQLNVLSGFKYRAQDALYQKATSTDPNIVVFGIDEKSLKEFGRFNNWGRDIMAEAITILNSSEEYKPAVIGIDILYDGISESSEADERLAKAVVDGGNVVVVSQVFFGEDMSLNKVVKEYVKPYPLLEEHVDYGLANGTIDEDFVVRNALLKIDYNGERL